MSEAGESAAPTFVACGARSGSTLLRFLVDAHPALSCPPETDLAVLLQSYVKVTEGLLGEKARPKARERAREIAEGVMGEHLALAGKARWFDKSLSNVFHLDLLAELWPEARFVLLHRHCMDMVQSGLEASPWGLAEYGFPQVAQRSPTDTVAALAAYWVDRTSRMVAFAARHPDRCLSIRYEDLVADTEAELERLWVHVGVTAHPALSAAMAAADRNGRGPADHTIWYTDGVHTDGLGRGARIPPDHVAGPLRESVNALLAALGYPLVDDRWGSGRTGGVQAVAWDVPWPSPGSVEVRIVKGHTVLERRALTGAAAPTGSAGDAAPGVVVAIERSALSGLASGEQNLGAALRARLVRYYGPPFADFDGERAVLGPLLEGLRARGGSATPARRP